MAWNDPTELVVGQTGQVYVAPLGTTLPTAVDTALNAAFVGLGYITEDGVSFSASKETQDIGAWQALDPLRTIVTSRVVQATFGLQQWNEDTVPLAFGGGTVTGSTGAWKYELPDPEDGLDERAMVIDVQDGDNNFRFVLPRGVVTEAVETQFQHGASAVLPITFKALKADASKIATVYSDADSFTAGS